MSDSVRRKVREFLSAEGMFYKDYAFEDLVEAFIREMDAGLAGGSSSLAMIPTYYTTPIRIPREEVVAVIDAGGTNLRRGVLRPSERFPDIPDFAETAMPGTRGPVSKDEFIHFLADFVSPVLEPSRRIGFCFSYPISNTPEKDAVILSLSKELDVWDILHVSIGGELLSVLKDRGLTRIDQIPVLNDTTALFLTGWHLERDQIDCPGGKMHIGFVLGTGANCCYMEENNRIPKVTGGIPGGSQIINIESGGFSGIRRGSADEDLDRSSTRQNFYILEKMTSGVYLGPLYRALLLRAASAGLFSGAAAAELDCSPAFDTRVLSAMLAGQENPTLSGLFPRAGADRETAFELADMLLERSALVASVPSAAIIRRNLTDRPKGSCSGVIISAEGSTMFKVPGYRDRIHGYLSRFAGEGWGIDVDIHEVLNGSLIGAGLAAVSREI